MITPYMHYKRCKSCVYLKIHTCMIIRIHGMNITLNDALRCIILLNV